MLLSQILGKIPAAVFNTNPCNMRVWNILVSFRIIFLQRKYRFDEVSIAGFQLQHVIRC